MISAWWLLLGLPFVALVTFVAFVCGAALSAPDESELESESAGLTQIRECAHVKGFNEGHRVGYVEGWTARDREIAAKGGR